MKKIIMSLLLVCSVFYVMSQQYTLVLQPGSEDGKDARLHQGQPYLNMGNADEFLTYYWTFSGNAAMGVSLIQFDLSEIPEGMTILDAKLSLYYNQGSSSAGQAGNNASYLKKITNYWDESSVSWNTMPGTTNDGAVFLETSNVSNQNYLDIDLTDIVSDWHNFPENNYGLMLEIIDQSLYNSMKFASSDCPIPELRPKLVVVYAKEQAPENCITLKPGPREGIDARLHGGFPDDNFGDTDEFLSYFWTFNGHPFPGYSVIKFDISALPDNVTITDAKLSLFHINSPSAGQTGNNACYLKKIVTPWNEHTVTWNTMPETIDSDQVCLEQSVSGNQNYPDIDITQFVTDWYENPEENYGIMLKIIDEQLYNSMKFASSDCSIESLRPELTICYDIINSNQSPLEDVSISIFPNPGNGVYNLNLGDIFIYANAVVCDFTGKTIQEFEISSQNTELNLSDFNNGIYFINIFVDGKVYSLKIVKI